MRQFLKTPIVTLLLLLTSCVPIAIVTGAAVAGSVAYDQRSLQTQMDDSDISLLAQDRLNAVPSLDKRSNITIATFNGVVLLVGQAQTPALREEVYKIVLSVPNVKHVYNEINIAGSSSDLSTSNDSWITAKVKSALVAKTSLNSSSIKIVTEAGVVYLMGNVTKQQAKTAVDVARHIDGVREVVKVFS